MKALDPKLVDDRLRAWESAISASPNPARLAQRWRYLGWSTDEARTRLAGAALFETQPPDKAHSLLQRGLARLESSPLGPLDDEVPFGEILSPLAHATADGLAGLPLSLVRELTRTLAELAAPALISELSSGQPRPPPASTGTLRPPRRGPPSGRSPLPPRPLASPRARTRTRPAALAPATERSFSTDSPGIVRHWRRRSPGLRATSSPSTANSATPTAAVGVSWASPSRTVVA